MNQLTASVSLMLIATLSIRTSASCLSMTDGFGTCPVGPAQVKSLQEASACSGTSSAVTTDQLRNDCVARVASATSNHTLYSVFGVMGVDKQQPAWIREFIQTKMPPIKNSVVDEFARAEFEASVRGEEINVATTRTKYYQLKTRADASTLTNRNMKAEKDFREFNNSEEMRTIRRVYGLNPNNLNEFIARDTRLTKKVFYPNTQNGLLREDLANMDWDDVPDSVTTTKGQRLGLKSKYVEDGHRIYNEVMTQLEQGKTLNEALSSQKLINMGVTGERKRRIGQVLVMAGRQFQLEANGESQRIANLTPRVTPGDGRKPRNKIRRLAMGLGVVGMGVGVAWNLIQQGADNQAMCDQNYPYSETRFEKPAVSAATDPAFFCKMSEIDATKPIPNKALNLAKLPATEIAQILDSDLKSNSTCAYFVKQFNARFCTQAPAPAKDNGKAGGPTNVTN